jgi:hypothetical protein
MRSPCEYPADRDRLPVGQVHQDHASRRDESVGEGVSERGVRRTLSDSGPITDVENHQESSQTLGMDPDAIGPLRVLDDRLLGGAAVTDGQIVTGGPGDVDVTQNWWVVVGGPSEAVLRRAKTATADVAAFLLSPCCADSACASMTTGDWRDPRSSQARASALPSP